MDKTPKELYEERLKRVEDAIHLRVPDKVPTVIHCGYMGAKYVGMTCEEAHYDGERALAGTKKIIQDVERRFVSHNHRKHTMKLLNPLRLFRELRRFYKQPKEVMSKIQYIIKGAG